jgi:membrane protein involved in colicin uptake
MLFPDVPVLLFFFPVPAKIMVLFLALLNLFSAMGTRSGVSFIAHIGGMAAGFVMLRSGRWTQRWSRAWKQRSDDRWRQQRAALSQRRDEILDKMSREGRESLSREEWRTLLEESKRMREGRD